MVAVCVWTWSLILARSTGQATTSWAAPPAHPAQKISQFVGFTDEERPPEEMPVLKTKLSKRCRGPATKTCDDPPASNLS